MQVLISMVAAMVSLFALAALGGAWSAHLDALTHFAPIYLAAALGTLAVGGVSGRRGRFTPIASVLAIAATLILMAPEYLAQRPISAPTGPTLKIVQFNVWGRNTDPQATAKWIVDQKADVVVLEEAFELEESVVKLVAPHFAHRTACSQINPGCSTIILSNVAPIATEGLAERPKQYLAAAAATLPGPAGPFTIVGVHYTWPWPPEGQARQRARLARAVAAYPPETTILVGDFNLTPWSFILREQDRRLGLERRTRGLFTWPAGRVSRLGIPTAFPVLPIDQVYAGSAWRTASVQRGPRLGSDHYPVVVVLTPAQPSPSSAGR